MRYVLKATALLLLACLLCGCTLLPGALGTGTSSDGLPSASQTDFKPDPTGGNDMPGDALSEEMLYRNLFDFNCKVELRLDMDEKQLAAMQRDYEAYGNRGSKSPIYRMADLHVTLTTPDGNVYRYTVEQVGVRMKGNTSRTSFYSASGGIYNLIHLKLSFQETFDKEAYYGTDALVWENDESRKARKERTFATLEKMDIRWNKCNDATYIREYYAFEMYRANGVLAPRTNLASVDWAGYHCGVYTIYEPVDKIFLERNLPTEKQGGDLYKLGWTSVGANFTSENSIGVENEDDGLFFTYDLKTNKKKSDHAALRQFIQTLNGGGVTKQTLQNLVDMDSFLSFAAVSYFLGNPDDLRNNYNNCYVYFPPEGGCLFIPTDYDRCLGLTYEWDPTGDGVTSDGPFTLHLAANGEPQSSPLFLYTVCQGGFYVEEYTHRLRQIAASQWMTLSNYQSLFDKAKSRYGNLCTPDPRFSNAAARRNAMTMDGSDGNWTIEAYFSEKLATFERAMRGELPSEQLPSVGVYIRAEFTNWDMLPEYRMEETDDGLYRLTIPGGAQFKVYDEQSGAWYGTEALSENTSVWWGSGEYGNIILSEGTYQVVFDPAARTVTVTEA